ncbi:MAG: homoserine dehydrogenase [Clostridiales bacterium]|nr:homoserine dehydrogenase [Clostridiales bacterium]
MMQVERSNQVIKIAILGMGTVGSGVVAIMNKRGENIKNKVGTELKVEKILVKDNSKKREIELPPEVLTYNVEDILDDPEIELIVELMGGEEPAYEYITKAISKGKSVVTANKLVIAKYGDEILKLARENEVQVSFEASVAGGIPIIRPLKESLVANRIEEIYGILNGTTNYILTKMTQERIEFDKALEEAQRLGYAERDPSSDTKGFDAAYKIAILSSIAFETSVDADSIYIEGIEGVTLEDIKLADELGYVIKLLAIGKKYDDGLNIRVHPAFISKNHPLAMVNGAYNAIYLYGDAVGDVMLYGKGAGQMPTGSAVVADIIQVAKDINYNRLDTHSLGAPRNQQIKEINQIDNSFYLRIQVLDKPGVMSQVTKVLGDNHVSLSAVSQKHMLTPIVPLVLITHPVKEENMRKSLYELENLESVVKINNLIRVEKKHNG